MLGDEDLAEDEDGSYCGSDYGDDSFDPEFGYLDDETYLRSPYYSEVRNLQISWKQLSQTSWKSFTEAHNNIVDCRDSLEPNHHIGKDFYTFVERVAHVLLLLKYVKKFMDRYRFAPESQRRWVSPGRTMGILYKYILPYCQTTKTADREMYKTARNLVFMALEWHGYPSETISSSKTHPSSSEEDFPTMLNSGIAAISLNKPETHARDVECASKSEMEKDDSLPYVLGPYGPKRYQVMLPFWWVPAWAPL
jgi:hypothetical protein